MYLLKHGLTEYDGTCTSDARNQKMSDICLGSSIRVEYACIINDKIRVFLRNITYVFFIFIFIHHL